jgi:hypothetical protein
MIKMKIGRNDKCPCGSGEKYKRCCINKPKEDYVKGAKSFHKKDNDVDTFFTKYNTASLLKSFAGLSLLPENHGKNVRMEELARMAVQNFNKSEEVPSAIILREFLEAEYPSHYLEDPTVNLFSDLVTFYGGDYLLFPGITENGIFTLDNLLAAIYHWPDSKLPKQFRINSTHTITLILAISNKIALRLGYKRYQEGLEVNEKIIVPNDNSLDRLKEAVIFSEEEIKQLCLENGIAFGAIDEFLLDINSPDIHSRFVEESPLIYKPILKIDNQFIVVSPSTLSFAITDYIWSIAERMGCMKELNDAYHNFLWNNLQMQLGHMKFNYIDVIGVPINKKNHVREGLYRFDDDKIAYIQYLSDEGLNFKMSKTISKNVFDDNEDKEIHKKDIKSKLLAIPEYADYEILDLTIISPIGREFMYPVMKSEFARTIAIPIFEFDVLWNLKDMDALDLWKFSIAREEQVSPIGMISFSFLDQYKIYKDHHDSFYLTDERKYDSISVQVGYADDLIKQSKHKTDKHSALKNIEGRLVNVQVVQKDSYMPVYVDPMGLLSSKLEFLIEGFYQPIWVTPKFGLEDLTGEIRNVLWQVNDAIVYWLWQIQADIKEDLRVIGSMPLTVTFDLDSIKKFETIERDFKREEGLSDKFQTIAVEDSFNIVIPDLIIPYLYGSDNAGEREIVKHLIIGINKILEVNNQQLISNDRITQIIESKAPLGMKKKFFVLDTNDNLLLDPRNLIGHRYVQEYDTSIVLDSIVPLLGTLCPSVGEIVTQNAKDDLSFKIVQKALLPHLRSEIIKYDSTELLKRFISQYESIIRKREELRVHTPTRIACFVTVDQHQIDLQEDLKKINKSSMALRCLIEHVGAEPSKGEKIISDGGIDELVAIMDQIISWGSISDQIHYNLFDVKLSVLNSGRIGVEKTQFKDIFDPYYTSKTNENITDAISTFNQVFPQNENSKGKDVPENLDNAFIADYGISFSRICEFIEGLCHIGFFQTTPYASFFLNKLRDEVNKYVNDFDKVEFQCAIDYLSITNRGKVDKLPEGYDYVDIMPWRFNRMLSFLRKPIVIVDSEKSLESKVVYWGVRNLLDSRIYLAGQFYSDRLRVFENSNVKRLLGKFANERGEALVKKIKNSIDPDGLIIENDVFIGPSYSLKNNIDIGDIDILIIDTKKKIIFSIECKSMSPSRNIKEMIEEVQKLFGSNSEMGWIDKHLRRHEWLLANRDQLSNKYKIDVSDFEIKSVFVTNEDMLTPYLRKQKLPIPFMTSYEFEKEGYETLLKI